MAKIKTMGDCLDVMKNDKKDSQEKWKALALLMRELLLSEGWSLETRIESDVL